MGNKNEIEGVIEIRAPEIDAEAIMREIRENIRQRCIQAQAAGLDYAALASGTYTTRFDDILYLHLQQMETSPTARPAVNLTLAPPPAIPLVGALIQRLRAAFHQLALYYVTMLAEQQRQFNAYVIQTCKTLIKELEQEPSPDEIQTLRTEVARLREQVNRLTAEKERADS